MPFIRFVWCWLIASGLIFGASLTAGEFPPSLTAPPGHASSSPGAARESLPAIRRLPEVESASPDETLEAAWRHALRDAPLLKAGAFNVDAASSSAVAARAQYGPSASLGASYVARQSKQSFRIAGSNLLPGGGTFPFAQREGVGLHAAVQMPVYYSGRIYYEVLARESEAAVAQHEQAEDVLNLKMQVAVAFLEVLRAESRLRTAATHEQSVESHLEAVKKRRRNEQVSQHDLLVAEVSMSDARVATFHARAELDGARATYNRLLHRPLELPVKLLEPTLSPVPWQLPQATQLAVSQRPEIARLRAEIEAFRHQGDVVLAANRLQISLRAGYDFQENRYQTPQGLGSVGVNGSWNFFDSGRARAERNSRLQRADALAQLRDDLEQQIQLEVKRAWLDWGDCWNRLQLLQKSVEQAGENLRVARNRFQNGWSTNTEVLEAESFYTRTCASFHEARYDAMLAEVRLRKAAGIL